MQTPPPALLAAIDRLLRPLVRLLIARGISFPLLMDRLRRLYVEVAASDFPLDGKDQTVSRLSLLTGVHRKEVKRLREAPTTEAAAPVPSTSPAAHLIGLWLAGGTTADGDGMPRPLPRLAEPDQPSFQTLAETVSRDLRPRAILDELVRRGICRIDADDRVHLDPSAMVPQDGQTEKLHYFGMNLYDHMAASVQNLMGDGSPQFDRATFYDGLTAADTERLRTLAARAGMQALLKVNREAVALRAASAGQPDAVWRMAFGAYFHLEPMGLAPMDRDPVAGGAVNTGKPMEQTP